MPVGSRPPWVKISKRWPVPLRPARLASIATTMHSAPNCSATTGERHEAALSRALHHIEDGVAIFMTCGDVEEAELVGAGLVIGRGGFHGVAGVVQIDEVHALDAAAVLYVEAWNEADLEHRLALADLRRSCAKCTIRAMSAATAQTPSSTRPAGMLR